MGAGDMGDYISNSKKYTAPDPAMYPFNFAFMLISVAVLAHSWHINKWLKYTSVRVLTELCAMSCLSTSVLVFIGYYSSIYGDLSEPDITLNAISNDEVINGILNLTIQLTDNYMFWYRYMVVVPEIPLWKKILVHSWVGLVMCPWVITYFPMPLFIDVNGDYYASIDFILNEIYAYGQIAFNTFFSFEFGRILYLLYFDKNCRYTKAAGHIAWLTILHCIFSDIGCLLITYTKPMGVYYQDLINMISLHFLFNYRWRKGRQIDGKFGMGFRPSTLRRSVGNEEQNPNQFYRASVVRKDNRVQPLPNSPQPAATPHGATLPND